MFDIFRNSFEGTVLPVVDPETLPEYPPSPFVKYIAVNESSDALTSEGLSTLNSPRFADH